MTFIKSTFILAFVSILFAFNINAQEDEAHVVVEYMKVKPGMMNKYLECEAVWKTLHQHRVKSGAITGWELEQVLYPSGTNHEYDYVTITHYKSWDAIDAEDWNKYDNVLSEKDYEAAMDAYLYRDCVKREIWTAGERVFTPDGKRPEIMIENFMNIPAGGFNAWHDMELEIAKPIMEKSVKNGTRAGWMTTFKVLPRTWGEDEYQVSTLDIYEDWSQMNIGDGKAIEALHPGKTMSDVFGNFSSVRTILRSEVRRLVDYVE